MQCGSRSTFDFCDKPACVGCTIENRDDTSSPHLPTHDFVKIRAPIVQYREIGKVLRNATASLERAKALLEKGPIDSEQKQGEEMEKSVGYHEEFVGGSRRPDDKAPTSSQEKTVTRTPGKPDTMRPSDMGSANEVATPTCLKCKAPVSQPCFYCIDCPSTFPMPPPRWMRQLIKAQKIPMHSFVGNATNGRLGSALASITWRRTISSAA